MFFDIKGKLKWTEIAGGSIISKPPLYSRNGEYIMFVNEQTIQIYSTITGKLIRHLTSNAITAEIASFQLELEYDDILLACSRRGELVRWHWPTGEVKDSIKLKQRCHHVENFNLLNLYNESGLTQGFLMYKMYENEPKFHFDVINRETGEIVGDSTLLAKLQIYGKINTMMIAVDSKNFTNLVICHGQYLVFVDYTTWKWIRHRNPRGVELTAVQMHPKEECIAAGDKIGRIFLWRKFYGTSIPTTSLYHWHHTAVTSIAFTPSGASFYSSGEEAVLVSWNIQRPELRHFMPRMSNRIRHVVVGPNNAQFAVCTYDNSVQLIGTEKKIKQNLQEFTFIADDKTNRFKFPVGLRWNPRMNALVLNGRSGSLQFYNTHTRNLLYNLNIVNENIMSMERDRILYDTQVVKAAFNIDWMATGEVYNDEEHFPEVRLKFWKYVEEQRSYALTTNIEFPHEGGFRAIEFSHELRTDNLLCATVGEDNIIKMWCADTSNNIYHSGKTWYCIAKTRYKSLPLKSISFSQDASLLAAGYGNVLCIYEADKLQLKATLTPPAGLDGNINKIVIEVPKIVNSSRREELIKTKNRVIELFNDYTQKKSDHLIKELMTNCEKAKESKCRQEISAKELSEEQKLNVYEKIMNMFELNLFQKIRVFQYLHIRCKYDKRYQKEFNSYHNRYLKYFKKDVTEQNLLGKVGQVNPRKRFKAKYRLDFFMKRNKLINDFINDKLMDSSSVLNIKTNNNSPFAKKKKKSIQPKDKTSSELSDKNESAIMPQPLQILPEITFVQFAVERNTHLVLVCLPNRIIIWNVMTLRIYTVLKLSVQHISFDRTTNQFAVVTTSDELHVFQSDGKISTYIRRNMPEMYGMIWIPRRIFNKSSILIDWQAQSTLYFLNKQQKIMCLTSEEESVSQAPTPFSFDNPPVKSFSYTTFGVMATKAIVEVAEVTKDHVGPVVFGQTAKQAVEKLINMSTHTMPPASQIVESFLSAIVKRMGAVTLDTDESNRNEMQNDNAEQSINKPQLNGCVTKMNGIFSTENKDSDTVDDEGVSDIDDHIPNGLRRRKELLKQTEDFNNKYSGNEGQDRSSLANYDETKLLEILNKDFRIDWRTDDD